MPVGSKKNVARFFIEHIRPAAERNNVSDMKGYLRRAWMACVANQRNPKGLEEILKQVLKGDVEISFADADASGASPSLKQVLTALQGHKVDFSKPEFADAVMSASSR